jgi:hypothetical protein
LSGTALPVANGGTGQTSYTDGQLLIGNTTGNTLTKTTLTAGSGISITNGAGLISIASTATGTVTSVTGTSPVVSSGGTTPAISLAANYGDTQNPYASKTANFVLAAPNGSAGVPTFRAVVAADIPTLNQNTTGNAATVTTNANLTGAITSSGNATSLGSFTSAQLATALTDETGTGANVFATSPTLVTPALGTPTALVGTNITGTANSLNAGLGVNQTWQGVTGSRAIGTTYTNSTGKPITVTISYTCSLANTVQGLVIDGTTVYASSVSVNTFASGFTLIVPDGATYVTVTNNGTLTLVTWAELR